MTTPEDEKVHEPGNCRYCGGTGRMLPDDGTRFKCYDCRRPAGSYMVHRAVWDRAWPEYRELKRSLVTKYRGTPEWFRAHLELCLGCLEKRLGRPLSVEDFDLKLPINDGVFTGIRIASRR